MTKIILDLCGGTGAWSKPYADAGYTVHVVDLERDRNADVRLVQYGNISVHGILAAPPCTHLSGSGARWWAQKGPEALLDALSIADACLRWVAIYKPVWWALENPVGRLRRYYGPPRYIFNPCDHGDSYTKRTCLWGNFKIPERTPVEATEGSRMHKISPGPDRWKIRSMTPAGFAKAFFDANP